jgi:anti-sigma factor RsiW
MSDAEWLPETCDAVRGLLWDHLDGRLDAPVSEAVRAHVAECARCFRTQAAQRTFFGHLALVRARVRAPLPLRARVLRALRRAGWRPGYRRHDEPGNSSDARLLYLMQVVPAPHPDA